MVLLEKITHEVREQALEEAGYTEASLKEDLERLKNWIAGQAHLPPSLSSEPDFFLEFFLVGCKKNSILSRSKLDNIYSIRSNLDWLYDNRDPELLLETKNIFHMAYAPRTSTDGSRVLFASTTNSDPGKFDLEGYLRRLNAIWELKARMEGPCTGEWFVHDCSATTPAHFLHMNFLVLKDSIYMMKYQPSRIKGVVLINAPSFAETYINNLVKPLMSKKLSSKYHIYSQGNEALLNHFPKNIIPKEYGGEGEELKKLSDAWIDLAISKKDWFLNELSEKVDETKRLGGDELAGQLHGSFRKLEVD